MVTEFKLPSLGATLARKKTGKRRRAIGTQAAPNSVREESRPYLTVADFLQTIGESVTGLNREVLKHFTDHELLRLADRWSLLKKRSYRESGRTSQCMGWPFH